MNPTQNPPNDTIQIRCARLGHQIHFSYCRKEHFGLPCPRIITCWQHLFAVIPYLRRELTEEEWRQTFEKPVPSKVLTLVELIEQVQQRSETEDKTRK